ncbi:MAG: hypothetical protein EOO68_04060 [Moraxellaceae bacterium]|nr:MAG: hypothetical protein EOO68_04060 [Moraxellaceae bacterium]
MITKRLITFFVFFLSANAFSAATITNNCKMSLDIANTTMHSLESCNFIDDKEAAAKDRRHYENNIAQKTPKHIQLSKRQPSIAETLMTMFFIPGLVLLWFSRFTKSNK